MKPTSTKPSKNTLFSQLTLNLDKILLSIFSSDGKLLIQTTIQRILPDVERKEIRKEGIVGTLFYPKGTKKNPGREYLNFLKNIYTKNR